MDPLVKAHLRIAALEQQLREPAVARSSFVSHQSRVIPMPGDRILCVAMVEPMDVLQTNIYFVDDRERPKRIQGYVLSGIGAEDKFHHKCRTNDCLETIKVLRRSREDFEKALLHVEYGDGGSNGSTG